MGGSKSTENQARRNGQGSRTDTRSQHLEKLQQELQDGRRVPEAMEDMLRQDYHDLLVQHDELQDIVTTQDREIASYRNIILQTSSNEMGRRMDEVQDQLRQFSVDLDWFKNENLKIFHEINKRSQHKFSMRTNLDRLTRTLLLVTEENQTLKRGSSLEEDGLAESESEDFDSTTGSGEKVLSETSTIHRKKARTNLRSQEPERHTPRSGSSRHEQLAQSPERPKDELLTQISDLRAEFVTLQSKLESAETHIINMGGNLGALLPREEVKDDFKSLVGAIQIWITTCVRPAVSNDDQCFEASERARNTWIGDAAQGIGRVRNQDFFAASKFPGADESIFLVMIFDLLIDHVFSAKVLYGNQDLQREIDVIRQLEPPMRLNSDSSKALYNARRWVSEAMTAILAREETQALRADFSNALANFVVRAIGLEAILGPNSQAALDAAAISIRQNVVLPAIELRDKMACAIDKYSFEVPSYWSEPCVFQTHFFRDLGNLDCKNFGEGPPRFRLEKMQKQLSANEIKRQLRAICPAIPALVLTEIDNSTWGSPTILVKQQVWVSWHPGKKLSLRNEDRGYFWFFYNSEATPREG